MQPKTMHKRLKGNTKTDCKTCDKEFTTFASYIKDGRGKYCSVECGRSALRRYPEGMKKCSKCKVIFEKNKENFMPNRSKYDGFSTECRPCAKENLLNNTLGAKRRFIESRGSKCAKCGLVNQDTRFFDIDHITPVFVSGIKRKQYSYKDADNLQILCPNCHRRKTMTERGWLVV